MGIADLRDDGPTGPRPGGALAAGPRDRESTFGRELRQWAGLAGVSPAPLLFVA